MNLSDNNNKINKTDHGSTQGEDDEKWPGKSTKKSPWDEANYVSKYFLYFMWPLLWRGEKGIGIDDQKVPPNNAQVILLTERLDQNYKNQLRKEASSSFFWAFLKTFGPELFRSGILDVIARCVWQLTCIIGMGWLIRDVGRYLEIVHKIASTTRNLNASQESVLNSSPINTNHTLTNYHVAIAKTNLNSSLSQSLQEIYMDMILDTASIVASMWLVNLFRHPYILKSYYVGLKCKAATTNLIYKKALRLNQESLTLASTGRLTNLLSNDVNRFETASTNAINLITAPLQVIVVMIIMYFYVGLIPMLTFVASILVLNIIQSLMGRGFAKCRLLTAARSDERIRIINELIVGIKIIKMYAWEEPLKALVEAARRREVNMISLTAVLNSLNLTTFLVSFILTCFASLVTYIVLGYKLNAELVYITISFCRTIRFPVMYYFPNAVAAAAETIVSCDRIDKFLQLPEHEDSSLIGYKQDISLNAHKNTKRLIFDKVTASWQLHNTEADLGSDQSRPIFSNVSLELKHDDLLFVIGKVGAGKSSLMMSILGELPLKSGKLQVNGKLSYSPQEAWIFPGSVRENILFGCQFDEQRYNRVIDVCSLSRDMEILPYGDKTLVGERGVSLSGGQKARVNLARALYHEADIYLLDDPLSAVDPPVARDIFRKAIQGFLKDKCVVLASHQLQFSRYATRLLVLDEPTKAPLFGTVDEVYRSNSFKELGLASGTTRGHKGTSHETDKQENKFAAGFTSMAQKYRRQTGSLISRRFLPKNLSIQSLALSDVKPEDKKQKDVLQVDDSRQTSTEKLIDLRDNSSSYKYYLSEATGCVGLLWFIVITIISQSLIQYTDVYLGLWADSVRRRDLQGAAFKYIVYTDYLTQSKLILIFTAITILTAITCFFRTITFYHFTLKASIHIHKRFFASIISAPSKFFDFSPIGILLSRLGRDIGIIDGQLPQTYSDVYVVVLNTIAPMILVVYVNPWYIMPSILLIVFSLAVRAKLSRIIIKLKALEGIRGAPILTHLSVTLNGLTTIRAFKTNEQFTDKCEHLLDSLTAVAFLYTGAAQLMSLLITILALVYCSLVITTSVFPSVGSDSPSMIGLLVSQVIIIPFPVQWAIRLMVEAESQMTSVTRVRDYSDLEPEETASEHHHEEAASCLVNHQYAGAGHIKGGGEIRFVDMSLRYFPDEPYVLKNLNIIIRQGEKVGVVGRTGAGKSSIIGTLFRLYPFEGRVEIDGQDTKLMSLRQLRSSISIIPQDPVLFAGTIRKNLDPFSNHTDQELWSALEAVQLKNYFMATRFGLEHQLQESGSNMSVGQRQLICLARAIIRQNNILVLDEATANVDPETDAFIQQTIKTQFADCTVITIAHRLITIADSDKVLVLDQGEVKEFDDPYRLLHNKDGIFRQLVESGRKHQIDRLKKSIKDAHHRRKLALPPPSSSSSNESESEIY